MALYYTMTSDNMCEKGVQLVTGQYSIYDGPAYRGFYCFETPLQAFDHFREDYSRLFEVYLDAEALDGAIRESNRLQVKKMMLTREITGEEKKEKLTGHLAVEEFEFWYVGGVLHRDDGPAFIDNDYGEEKWYQHGELHRDDDKPAVIIAGGTMEWYQRGKLHRDDDKPAVIETKVKKWYQRGKLHREGDKPAYIFEGVEEKWYHHGELHREGDKPAVIHSNGTKYWYQNGLKHREDAPAVIFRSGAVEWYKNGEKYDPE